MGNVLSPNVWCRQPWCREDPAAEHFAGDGCTCDGHGREVREGEPEVEKLAEFRAEPQPQAILLTAKASRLSAFACRACGAKTRRMMELPAMYFRCEPCAAANRWAIPRAGGT